MTASSTEFINALFAQTGGFIQDLLPLFYWFFSLVIALFVFGIIYKGITKGFKNIFK